MENGQEFTDYYALLQVTPSCDTKIIEKAYRHFAQMYHPDHAETADVEKFQAVIDAYNVLKDDSRRAKYDLLYHARKKDNPFALNDGIGIAAQQDAASNDADIHERILLFLYKKRREHADDPGVVAYTIQNMLDCSDEDFEFHCWYLKSKGFIEISEQGTLMITIDGVDHVFAASQTSKAERLLIPKGDTG